MPKTIRRTHAGDAANIFVRCMLSDISDMLGGCSAEEIDQTVRYFDYKCPYTGQDIRTEYEENKWVLDHLIPHNREACGLNLYGNMMVTTGKVNTKKGAKDFKAFIRQDTDGTDAEKEQRIKKIEQFQQESGYFQKVKNIDEIKALCKEQYDFIGERLKNLTSEYADILSIEYVKSPSGGTKKTIIIPISKCDPVHEAAEHKGVYTFTIGNFQSYMQEIRGLSRNTTYQYATAVTRILEIEQLSFGQLQSRINGFVQEYGTGGIKEELGRKGHNTWISALKRLQDFTVFLKTTDNR